jgi:hypothetical protein
MDSRRAVSLSQKWQKPELGEELEDQRSRQMVTSRTEVLATGSTRTTTALASRAVPQSESSQSGEAAGSKETKTRCPGRWSRLLRKRTPRLETSRVMASSGQRIFSGRICTGKAMRRRTLWRRSGSGVSRSAVEVGRGSASKETPTAVTGEEVVSPLEDGGTYFPFASTRATRAKTSGWRAARCGSYGKVTQTGTPVA